jgi:hypothetical protein
MEDAWYSDTDPHALKVFIDAQRRLSPGQKVAAVLEMSQFVMSLAEENVRSTHTDFTEREIFLMTVSRWLGRETMIRVYGWDPGAARP